MKKLIFCIISIVLFSTSNAFAWSQADKISEIKIAHGNQVLVKFNTTTWHGCGTSPFFIISEGDNVSTGRKQMLAIALTALAGGKSVWITTGNSDGDTPACSSSGYEWIYQLSIYP